jgi:putative ABC transport system substrate-binding protein
LSVQSLSEQRAGTGLPIEVKRDQADDRIARATTRRTFVAWVIAALSAPVVAIAQSAEKLPRLGILSAGVARSASIYQALESQLRKLGWVDGRTITIEFRSAEGHPDRLHGLASELVRSQVDLMLLGGPEAAARAARQATTTIPTVIVAIDYDPLANGYVASLARPGGNITGLFLQQPELGAKRVELLKDALPRVTRAAVLWDVLGVDQMQALDSASRQLGLQLQPVEVKSPAYDFESAIESAVKSRAGALLVVATPMAFRDRARIASIALRHRLPTVFAFREGAEAGGLLAYGADLESMFRAAASFLDKILKGARPADLPMEQPTTYDLVVNLKTAKALKLSVPAPLLERATLVVQ